MFTGLVLCGCVRERTTEKGAWWLIKTARKDYKRVCVNSQLHNYWTECVINAICLRKEGQVLIPWAVPCIWHWWLSILTSIFQRRLEINLFLRCSDLFAHLLILSKFLSISPTYKAPATSAVAFPWIIGFGLACFVSSLLKATLICIYW